MNTKEIIQALEQGIENTQELLDIHDRDLGRTTDRNKRRAQAFEYEIEHAQQVIRELKEQAVPTAVMEAKAVIELVGSASNNNHNHSRLAREWMQRWFPN